MVQLINTYFRSNSRDYTLQELFESKNKLSDGLHNLLNHELMKYGYIVTKVLIEDIDPPANVKATMNTVLESKNKREATIILAEAKREAMILEAEAEQKTMIMKAEALAETRRLEGLGLAAQRKALAEELSTSMHNLSGGNAYISAEESTNIILEMQRIDMMNTAAHNGKNVFIWNSNPSTITDIGTQMTNALIATKNIT